MDDDQPHHSLAAAVRRLTEALARASSTDGTLHHRSFVEQLDHLDPATSTRAELRALTQHARMAVAQPQPSPVPVVLAVAFVCLGYVLSLVAPEPDLPYDVPVRGVIGQLCHVVGFIAIGFAVMRSRGIAQHVAIGIGLLATATAQVCILTTAYAPPQQIVEGTILFAKTGEAVGIVGLVLVAFGLCGHRRTFVVGWRTFAVSIGVLCASEIGWAVAFARRGDTYWVLCLSLIALGGAFLARHLYRYVPVVWLVCHPVPS